MSGMFITFEGTDGSGKTSVIKAIVKELEKNGKTEYVLSQSLDLKESDETDKTR